MRFIDLFCGIGGFRLGLEKLGHECVFSCDIDDKAREAYQANFGDMPHGDITSLLNDDVPPHDILCGGFPCQPFSIAGHKKGFDDIRGGLIDDVLRITRHHKPQTILLENVARFKTMNGGYDFRAIEGEFESLGYHSYPMILNSAAYGIPQSRKRLYWLLRLECCGVPVLEQKPLNPLERFLEDDASADLFIKTHHTLIAKTTRSPYLKMVGFFNKNRQGMRVYSPEGVASTQVANGGGWGAKTGLYLIGDKIRRLSIVEQKRVMGFPDDWIVSEGNQGRRQLGNAVIPQMVSLVLDLCHART